MKQTAKKVIMALCLLPGISVAQNNFTVKGKLSPSVKKNKAYLRYNDLSSGKEIKDSSKIVNGAFQFVGKVNGPVRAYIFLDNTGTGIGLAGRDYKRLYLDKENIQLSGTDSISKSKISGSKINKEYEIYEAYTKDPIKGLEKEIHERLRSANGDTTILNSLTEKQGVLMNEQVRLPEMFIRENPDAYFSVVAVGDVFSNSRWLLSEAEIFSKTETLFNSLSPRLKDTELGKIFADMFETNRKTGIGALAMDFTQNDINGKPVKLSDFRGKYVLLDFWASWCSPCRAENPNVLKAYHTFKDKNFTILGVSLDDLSQKEAWLKAIKDDGLPWTQVSDLQGWRNAPAKMYGVGGIPTNFLIDPQGKIVASNLRGAELEKKLAELLK